MWAACLENRVLLRAITTACRGHSTLYPFHGICRRARELEEERRSAGAERAPLAVGAPSDEDEPSWVKRGLISFWPPIVPPR